MYRTQSKKKRKKIKQKQRDIYLSLSFFLLSFSLWCVGRDVDRNRETRNSWAISMLRGGHVVRQGAAQPKNHSVSDCASEGNSMPSNSPTTR
jgi:hypothetical protein